ncbi:MAG: hypothetical protein IPN97_08340 [Saprospiraceae bacterium]|nr:hypothetical protein [Saprospiraceae bacterium]
MNLTFNGGFIFKSNNAGNTIQTFGKSMPYIAFEGTGGEWILQDDLTSSSVINLTAGTLNTNNVTVTAQYLHSTGSNIRSLILEHQYSI